MGHRSSPAGRYSEPHEVWLIGNDPRKRRNEWGTGGAGWEGRVNGKYAEFDWNPIRYLDKPVQRQMLAGFYRHARIGLVMPLDERCDRWRQMRTVLGRTTQRDWSHRFLKAPGEARAALRPAEDAAA